MKTTKITITQKRYDSMVDIFEGFCKTHLKFASDDHISALLQSAIDTNEKYLQTNREFVIALVCAINDLRLNQCELKIKKQIGE